MNGRLESALAIRTRYTESEDRKININILAHKI